MKIAQIFVRLTDHGHGARIFNLNSRSGAAIYRNDVNDTAGNLDFLKQIGVAKVFQEFFS
jgi:hypothetical protein